MNGYPRDWFIIESRLSAKELILSNCGAAEDLRVPWTAKRSNQSFLKEISPGCSLEGLMLKLRHQYFGYLMGRTDSLAKTLMLGKIEGRRRRDDRGWDGWMASPTQWTWIWASSRRQWRTRKTEVLRSMGSQRVEHSLVAEEQHNIIQLLAYCVNLRFHICKLEY